MSDETVLVLVLVLMLYCLYISIDETADSNEGKIQYNLPTSLGSKANSIISEKDPYKGFNERERYPDNPDWYSKSPRRIKQ